MMEDNLNAAFGDRPDVCSNVLTFLPEFRGKVRIANVIGRFAMIAGRRRASCRLTKDATINIDLNDRIERQMWGGCYERHVQRALKGLLGPGDVFVDVGAHIGYHSALASSLVGPRGRVFAFEADPRNFARLKANLRRFPWAFPIDKAVWHVTGKAVFERSSQPTESGWGTLTDVRDLGRGEHLALDAISLDEWWSQNAQKVSVMKVDAEGSEIGILLGAERLLAEARPAIIIEANDVVLHQAHASALELARILRECRFEIFELDCRGLTRINPEKAPRRSEVLALPSEHALQCLEKLPLRQHEG